MNKTKFIFGPIISRRLGVSLGVDLLPGKVCSLDCVYCEVGETVKLTNNREEFFPIEDILSELKEFLTTEPNLDYITFSGSGEPTLYSRLGEVVEFLKTYFPQYKIALLTNATTFCDESIFKELEKMDLIVPSLDAISIESASKINRPLKGIDYSKIAESLARFSQNYSGKIWLEVFIIPGINDSLEEIELIKAAALNIKHEKIQLNSLDRPGTEEWVESASFAEMKIIQALLEPLKAEIVSKAAMAKFHVEKRHFKESLIKALKVRPFRASDLMQMFNLNGEELKIATNELIEQNLIEKVILNGEEFFRKI